MRTAKDAQVTIQNVNLKIDPVVKESAESVLANMGLSMSAYIGMCLRQLAQNREIPFTQKADPEFWATEYRAYKTKRIVDAGIIEPMSKLYSDILRSIPKMKGQLEEELLAAQAKGTAPEMIKIAGNLLDGSSPFDKDIANVHARIGIVLATIPRFVEIFSGDENILRPFATYKAALESLDAKIIDSCYEIASDASGVNTTIKELFCTVFDIDASEADTFTVTRENSVTLVAPLFSYAIDAYDENPGSITLRYTGQIGGSALAMALSNASDYRMLLCKERLNVK